MSKREWMRLPSTRVALGVLGVALATNVWVLVRALRVPPVSDAPTTTVASLEGAGRGSRGAATDIQATVEDDLFSPDRSAPSTPCLANRLSSRTQTCSARLGTTASMADPSTRRSAR